MKIYLDLLPEDRKKEIFRSRRFQQAINLEILFLLPLVLLIIILASVNFILGIQKESIASQVSIKQGGGKYQELDVYEDSFKKSNELSASLLKIQKEHLNWAEELVAFGRLVPEGVRIENFGNKNYNIMVSGKAATRDGLLEFKEKLERDACIENVNIPLSNMMQKENVDFQLDFVLKVECLKKQQ